MSSAIARRTSINITVPTNGPNETQNVTTPSLRWILRLWHGHPTYDAPVLSAAKPWMCDTESMRRSAALLVHPSKRYPVAGESDVPGNLNRSSLKLNGLERQSSRGLGCNPIGNVIFTDRAELTDGQPKKSLCTSLNKQPSHCPRRSANRRAPGPR